MSESPHSREHVTSVFMTVPHYLAINRLSSALEIGKNSAVLLALNEGLLKLGMLPEEDYRLLDVRYRRKLKDIVAQNRHENSNVPVVSLEKQKEQQFMAQKERQFKGILEQWEAHPSKEWRLKVLAEAEKYKDKVPSARLVLDLASGKGEE